MKMKFNLIICLFIIFLISSVELKKKKKKSKKDAPKSPRELRPLRFDAGIFCDACRQIVQLVSKRVKNKTNESEVIDALDRICDESNFTNSI